MDSLLAKLPPQQRGVRGRWREARDPGAGFQEQIEALESIGYLSGSREPGRESGVTVNVPDRSWAGLNFLTSGHIPGALLLDMDGNVLHRWRLDFPRVWPDQPPGARSVSKEYWRRALLLPGGDVVAVFEGHGIFRVDRESRLVWANFNRAHHDFDRTPDGDLLVLTRKAHIVPRVSEKNPVLEDFLAVLDPETGEERRSLSLLECYERGLPDHDWSRAYFEFWEKERTRKLADSGPTDLFHTNAVEVLDARAAALGPAFRPGNVLVSMRNLDRIAVVDLEAERVVWSHGEGMALQHEPTLTADGRILIFNNHEVPNTWSSILSLDPAAGGLETRFQGTPERPFYSHSCGSVAELPNGNVLVTETDNGRAFELDPAGETVWEFRSPYRAGEEDRYVASLFELVRLPAAAVPWVKDVQETVSPAEKR